jgi:gliding motility-associated-like protein
MSNSVGFGFLFSQNLAGNLDIIRSSNYCGGAQNGDWYVALTSGGSDAFSLELSSPLIIGESYSISFYDRSCSPFQGSAIQIGVSETNNNFGDLVYSAPIPTNNTGWSLRTFSFIATTGGLFITVKCNGPNNGQEYWTNVDNFSFDCLINLNLGNDTTLCQRETLTLDATTPNATYIWQDNSTHPTLNVTQQGTYWVETKNNCGIYSDTIIVDLENCTCRMYIPNSFTPNFDDKNDQFLPLFDCDITEYSFLIFNHWGELIFETNLQNNSWNGNFKGEICPTGIYIYMIKYQYEESYQKKYGRVNLLK